MRIKLIQKTIISIKLLLFKKKKLNVGSGGINKYKSWIATDIDILDITSKNNWLKLFKKNKFDNIMAEHVWEHLNETDTELTNKNCYDFLKMGGVLRIAVPDGFHPDSNYIEYVKPGGNGVGSDDHKILYNYKIMKQRLENVGFKVNLLEYWDENGRFHFIDWSDEAGHIMRSRRYDSRNKNGKLAYTSLIVDAVKL
jgi:predicted SAM-dependent methyltransferase